MGKADRTLYSAFRRILQKFERDNIPFTGVAGTDLVSWNLNPAASLQSWFHSPPNALRFEDGARLLNRLESQLTVLQNCEEDTLNALSEWSSLAHSCSNSLSSSSSTSISQGCLLGMNLLSEHTENLMNPLHFDDNESTITRQEDIVHPEISIDSLVDEVIRREPLLFRVQNDSGMYSVDSAHYKEAIDVLSYVMYKESKLKYEPFEWVYDGLKPLLVPQVLKRKKGTPAALALIATAVGRRVGLQLLPMPAEPTDTDIGQDATSNVLDDVSPEFALRISTRAQSFSPGPGSWVLALDTDPLNDDDLFLESQSGLVMNMTNIKEKYPSLLLQGVLSQEENDDGGGGDRLCAWREQSLLRTWQGLCRIAIQAHQRRGESDFVAHWMYVLLALDPQAPEWAHALSAPDVNI